MTRKQLKKLPSFARNVAYISFELDQKDNRKTILLCLFLVYVLSRVSYVVRRSEVASLTMKGKNEPKKIHMKWSDVGGPASRRFSLTSPPDSDIALPNSKIG
jgi:hypothetical protein